MRAGKRPGGTWKIRMGVGSVARVPSRVHVRDIFPTREVWTCGYSYLYDLREHRIVKRTVCLKMGC